MKNSTDSLLGLKFKVFMSEFRAETVALWCLCLYIFFEYIRPQAMYPILDILPWGQFSILLALLSVIVTGNKPKDFGSMGMMFLAFSIIVILSAIFAWSQAYSLKYWSTYTSWILMYFCIVSVLTTPNRMLLFVIFFILINFKLSQHGARTFAMRGFSFASYGLSGSPGWFHNSGEFALQMVVMFSMSLSILIAAKKYITNATRWRILVFLFPVTSALSVMGSSSRGGQIALAVIVFLFFMKSKKFIRALLLLAVLTPTGLHFVPAEQFERFDTMGDDKTSRLRIMHWEHALETLSNNPMGIGYKNWRFFYKSTFDTKQIEAIHNTVLQAFVELGYPGGILFLLMIFTAFVMNARTQREMKDIDEAEGDAIGAMARGINFGLLGTFIAALFMSVLYYPMFWVAFALTSALRQISKAKVGKQNSRQSHLRKHH